MKDIEIIKQELEAFIWYYSTERQVYKQNTLVVGRFKFVK